MKSIFKKSFLIIIFSFFVVMVGFLFLQSVFSTSILGNYIFKENGVWKQIDNRTYYIADSLILHIFAFILITGTGYFFFLKVGNIRYAGAVLLLIYILGGCVFVGLFQVYPRSDQRLMLETVGQMRDGNYSAFQKGGYLYSCPNQFGLLLVLYMITGIFGESTWLAYQYMNVLFTAGGFFFISKIAKTLWGDGRSGFYVQAISMLFFPLLFYSTFVYGNIPGLFFTIVAVYTMILYNKHADYKMMILCILSLSIAIIFKTNNLIIWLALIIFMVYDLVMKPDKLRLLLSLSGLVLIPLLCLKLTDGIVSAIVHEPPSKGIPAAAYIAMGLQETKMAPGWWNGYNWDVFSDNNFDYALTNKAARRQINREIEKLMEHPVSAVRRFSKKTASQWNNPDFQCFELIDGRTKMNGERSYIETSLISGNLSQAIRAYMNIYQSWVLGGILLYLFFWKKERREMIELVPAVIFIGGFLFHLVWEAKCQYTLPYFFMIIPYAVKGYSILYHDIRNKKIYLTAKRTAIALGIFSFLFLVSKTTVFTKLIGLNDDTYTYKTQMEQRIEDHENNQ